MAKNSIKRSIIIALIAGIVAIVLAVPSILGAVEDAASKKDVASAYDPDSPTFFSSDPLGMMSVPKVKVTAPHTIYVYLVTKEVYDENKGDLEELFALRINRPQSQFEVNGTLTIRVPTDEYQQFYLVVNDMESPGTLATITFQKSVSSTFTGTVLLFMVAFVVSNIAWVAYLIPIERKYSAGSIYK